MRAQTEGPYVAQFNVAVLREHGAPRCVSVCCGARPVTGVYIAIVVRGAEELVPTVAALNDMIRRVLDRTHDRFRG